MLINDWWFKAPIINHLIYWEDSKSWPTPWHLLNNNGYCELARALGIVYTVMLVENYTDLNELESYLYIVALCDIISMEPVDGLRKIGRGDDYNKRMRSLTSDINKKYLSGTKGPYGYMPVRLWKGKTDIIVQLEKTLHAHLADSRYHGEFFDMGKQFYQVVHEVIANYDVQEVEPKDIVNGYDRKVKEFCEHMALSNQKVRFI